MRMSVLAAACLAIVSTNTPCWIEPAKADWSPTKPVEFVVMATEGGGADIIAKFIATLIKKHNLWPVETKVVNVPGRSGGDALSLLKNRSGDDHLLLFTLNSFFTVPLTQPDLDIDILAFAPIARLGLDPFLLWVHTDRTDVNSLADFVLTVTKSDLWTMAGTGSMTEDELLTIFLNYFYKLGMEYRPQDGGGQVARLLADKAVDSTLNNPGEIQSYHMARRVKPIAAFTKHRLPQYASTPTFWELGLELEYSIGRGVAGSPNMRREAVAFYSSVFEKVFNLPEWQDYRKRVGLVGEFKTGDPLQQYWRDQLELHRKMLEVAAVLSSPQDTGGR
jgi:putative tricarboxylic transport membrane protein